MKARLLDLGSVSFLRSQTIYHSVAYCTTEASPGTIVVLTPREPYVSIGFHQLLEKEIDTDYCQKKGIPIIRREVGGGTVFLDKDQLFFQCVFPRDKAPLRVDHLYEFFLQPAVNTYRSLGVDAYYRPVNDIQVDEKKISGTGAGRVGDASVVVGNIIFDFNYGEMSRVLHLSSERFRDKVHDSMQLYVTTLRRELDHVPDREGIKEILIEEFEELLGARLERGDLTPDEQRMLAKLDKKFTDPKWLYEKGGKVNDWVKISTDVFVAECNYETPGGRIRIILRRKNDTIDDIVISGDFNFQPKEELQHLEDQLAGQSLEAGLLLGAIESFYSEKG
ncbi:MAG: lipoate--protein ligase family protein, partial [Deltaproteobacteria bacterium]